MDVDQELKIFDSYLELGRRPPAGLPSIRFDSFRGHKRCSPQ